MTLVRVAAIPVLPTLVIVDGRGAGAPLPASAALLSQQRASIDDVMIRTIFNLGNIKPLGGQAGAFLTEMRRPIEAYKWRNAREFETDRSRFSQLSA